MKNIKKLSVLLLLLCHFIWGFQPLFWALGGDYDSATVLSYRIIWSVVFTLAMLTVTKRLKEIVELFKDWAKMRYLIPAALCMLTDWGIFIYAVKTHRVLDTSLGYFLSPLITMLLSYIIFKEKLKKRVILAIALAFTGFIISAVSYGSLPVISIMLAAMSIYASFKKLAKVEPLLSIAAETIIMLPFALVYLAFFGKGQAFSAGEHLFFAASGIITAVPMTLYTVGINSLPLLMVGFSQYISPSLSMLCGIMFLNETVSRDRLITFIFVWAGIITYMSSIVSDIRAQAVSVRGSGEDVGVGEGDGV